MDSSVFLDESNKGQDPKRMVEFIQSLSVPLQILCWVGLVIGAGIICWGIVKINKIVFRQLEKKNKGLHLSFFEHIISIVVVSGFLIALISSLTGIRSVWQTMLGGTAIVSAVVAFVAQDIIKDILAGLMISVHRPFEPGDRIVLEDGTNGIVETMTLRHVVLIGVDTLRYIIPNSKINAMKISNLSYHREDRAVQLQFAVGYESDMALVKRTIARAVKDSPYSLPNLKDANGRPRYADPYFLAFESSALRMQVTVYYPTSIKTEVIVDDINVRVREALREANIEIPYSYVNVITSGVNGMPDGQPAPPPSDRKATSSGQSGTDSER